MFNKLISIIIPAYNLEKYIEECIESIRKQTYMNIEIIVVDDGSVDDTLTICKRIQKEDSRVVVISQKNAGVTAARAKGVEVANGEYVIFVDGDDYVQTEMVEKMSRHIPMYDIVMSGFSQQTPGGDFKSIYPDLTGGYNGVKDMEKVYNNLLYSSKKQRLNAIGQGSLCGNLFQKDLILQVLDRVDKKITFAEDVTALIIYILNCNSIMFLEDSFYYYRYRENSAMHTLNPNMLENINRLYNVLKVEFDKHRMSKVLNEQLERWLFFLVINAMNSYMGFSKERRLPQFLLGLDEFYGKKLVVYGAGEVGQDIVWQYEKNGQKVYAWIDRDYVNYQKRGLPVKSNDVLSDKNLVDEIDAILIAVNSKEVADEIRNDLIQKGIPSNLVIWKKPICIY